MIFCSVNEAGTPAWKSVLEGKKTVTRRLKPVSVGKFIAVQPNRGKKAVGYIKVVSCRKERYLGQSVKVSDRKAEAKREGFRTWHTIIDWFKKKYGTHKIPVYRIEFTLPEVIVMDKENSFKRPKRYANLDKLHVKMMWKSTLYKGNSVTSWFRHKSLGQKPFILKGHVAFNGEIFALKEKRK